MKILILITLLFISTISKADIALYTADNNEPHDVSEMYQILENFHHNYREKNILFYVHGRKRNVEFEFERIDKVEKFYNVKVVMLHWDSYKTLLTRPTENAKKASSFLLKAFEEIKRFEENYKDELQDKSINLLCHSMGNLILKNTIELMEESHIEQPKLFDNYISIGADEC